MQTAISDEESIDSQISDYVWVLFLKSLKFLFETFDSLSLSYKNFMLRSLFWLFLIIICATLILLSLACYTESGIERTPNFQSIVWLTSALGHFFSLTNLGFSKVESSSVTQSRQKGTRLNQKMGVDGTDWKYFEFSKIPFFRKFKFFKK